MLEEIISTGVILGVGFLGFLLRGFFGSYVTEKGKNVATKEDIAQITTQVENVKAFIQTHAQIKTDYEQQRRQWLLSFYDSAIEIMYEKFSVNFGDFPSDNGKSLFEFQQSFRVLVASMVKEYQRIVLYFEHQDPLVLNAEKVLNAVLKADSVVKKRFGNIKLTFIEESAAFRSDDRQWKEEAVTKSNEANKVYWDEMRPIVETFHYALRQYLTFVNRFLLSDNKMDTQASSRNKKGT